MCKYLKLPRDVIAKMCGIFTLLNNRNTCDETLIVHAFNKGNRRGPEESIITGLSHGDRIITGFKRLAINGLDTLSGQPMEFEGCRLICNGEIYNFRELYQAMGVTPNTDSDCEVIIHLYKRYGIEQTLRLLDGVFAFVLYDTSDIEKDPVIHVARDPFGVRPLYMMSVASQTTSLPPSPTSNFGLITGTTDEPLIGFASEVKSLAPLMSTPLIESNTNQYVPPTTSSIDTYARVRQKSDPHTHVVYARRKYARDSSQQGVPFEITAFPPGTYKTLSKTFKVNATWNIVGSGSFYTTPIPSHVTDNWIGMFRTTAMHDTMALLDQAVRKRVVGTTDRPIVCLLSGGLDSSLITALVAKHHIGELKTFSIGMPGSEDLQYARKVAEHLGTDHTEVTMTSDAFFDAIPEVIEAIESYDTTTVRASVGNYLIGKYISQNTDAKVVFNGDGSDELTGGYLYFLKAPDALEFDGECRRLLKNIHAFDVLRSDRCISSHGLEPRTPFLDKTFVSHYLSLPASLRHAGGIGECEKHFLRSAVTSVFPTLLPEEVVWRTKEAFSDGVSGSAGSWFQIIQDKLEKSAWTVDAQEVTHNQPQTREQAYYRQIYDSLYPFTANTIPYFWMPRYVEATDSSARTLDIYKQKTQDPVEAEEVGNTHGL